MRGSPSCRAPSQGVIGRRAVFITQGMKHLLREFASAVVRIRRPRATGERAAQDVFPALWCRGLMGLDRTAGHLPKPQDLT
eukprot:5519170-Pyramimonas_sp.AAC.1